MPFLPLILIGIGVGGAIGLLWKRATGGALLEGLLPAYPRIVSMTPAQRSAVLAAAAQLGINPIALSDVIESESGWDPTAPHQHTGTPRCGLNQLTEGARLEGFRTADAVWAICNLPLEEQLAQVVIPYFLRIKGRSPDWTGLDLYKRNFLPADADRSMDFHLGEEGSSELVTPGQSLTRGSVYAANKGFDADGKGYFTWADVGKRLDRVRADAKGQLVDVAGNLHPMGAA